MKYRIGSPTAAFGHFVLDAGTIVGDGTDFPLPYNRDPKFKVPKDWTPIDDTPTPPPPAQNEVPDQ